MAVPAFKRPLEVHAPEGVRRMSQPRHMREGAHHWATTQTSKSVWGALCSPKTAGQRLLR